MAELRSLGIAPSFAAIARVQSSNMEGSLSPGDDVLLDQSETSLAGAIDRKVFALVLNDDISFHRVFKVPGGGLLASNDNRQFPDLGFTAAQVAALRVVGR